MMDFVNSGLAEYDSADRQPVEVHGDRVRLSGAFLGDIFHKGGSIANLSKEEWRIFLSMEICK